jgi:hypothetical protein
MPSFAHDMRCRFSIDACYTLFAIRDEFVSIVWKVALYIPDIRDDFYSTIAYTHFSVCAIHPLRAYEITTASEPTLGHPNRSDQVCNRQYGVEGKAHVCSYSV